MRITDKMISDFSDALITEGWLESNWNVLEEKCNSCGHKPYGGAHDKDEIESVTNQLRYFLECAINGPGDERD